jgi:hypothetical protein
MVKGQKSQERMVSLTEIGRSQKMHLAERMESLICPFHLIFHHGSVAASQQKSPISGDVVLCEWLFIRSNRLAMNVYLLESERNCMPLPG